VIAPSDEWHFDTSHIGRRVFVYDEVESTNSLAASFASPEHDGLVIVARHQSAGRGQHGRMWTSKPGSSLLLSVVLHPPPELRRPCILTAWAAVAVGDSVLSLSGAQARIKWPNDLLIRGKKVCGILIEQTTATVVGIGLNLNQTADEFADAGLPDATSLLLLSSKVTELRSAVETVVMALNAEYRRLLGGERVAVEADWKWRTGLLGRQIALERMDGTFLHGRLKEMSFDALELELPGGEVRAIVPETVLHIEAE
jgi:BirA family biotin operon repressor/biotin-[acetyl-CoA-carboxylase] ligase